jgi:hypothetical protein
LVVLVNQLWVSSDPRPYNQKPPAHRREASVASSLLPLFSGFPLFPKKPGRSFVPFFLLPRSNSPRLGLVRNAFARSTSAHHSLSFQPPASSSANSTPLDHLAILLIVLLSPFSPTQSTALTTSFVPRHYPPVETLASAAAAGTIGLLETPQSQLHFRQFHNHLLYLSSRRP